MLEARNVVASYGKTRVLNGLSVGFEPGRMTALVGPNGCGKSTLLKAIMGFVPLRAGIVRLAGEDLHRIARRGFARRIAYLPQESHCPDYMTLGELVELAGYARYSLLGGPSARDRELFAHALETVGLADMADRQVNALSGGQRQRAFIAMVLAQDAEIVLMDEPVNHLDMKYQYAVLDLVRDLTETHGKTVVTVLHDLNLTTTFADNVVMMREGRLEAMGAVGETVTAETVSRVFDLDADIFARNGRLVCLPNRDIGARIAPPTRTEATA
ncbi:iron complex transport system ATP-binding protein [Breoghania corrubedonensis]|uniref:Iron complex transport system ATP-binding protein n=1 Tax=Breoghania corrubedonensis TaxID=665038 RepID=A0A2T5UYH9_9HYPH|nr:ABC transporter ATP-binding protein [Breoghania corrubedonensis]PTW56559.1 iron complex transport system ATP-binding protein [Breoghania corrubedonensis]